MVVLISKFKELSRVALDLISSGCMLDKPTSSGRQSHRRQAHRRPTRGNSDCNNNSSSHLSSNSPWTAIPNGNYEEIDTIKHETTFDQSKAFFSSRSIFASGDDSSTGSQEATLAFDAVGASGYDHSTKGNVKFMLRSLNGPQGIWNPTCPANTNLPGSRVGNNGDENIRYYLLPDDAPQSLLPDVVQGKSQILVTRKVHPRLEAYDPLMTVSGPWKVQWDSARDCYVHLMKVTPSANNNDSESSVRFLLDDTILQGATEQSRLEFSRQVIVSFAESQHATKPPGDENLVDNNEISGPLRLILAASCYRWPGGVVLQASGRFDPERAIPRFQAFHSRVSREVLVGSPDAYLEEDVELDTETMAKMSELLKAMRCSTYEQIQTLIAQHPQVVDGIKYSILTTSSLCSRGETESLLTLRKTLQSFVLFLAFNCLDVEQSKQDQLENGPALRDFEALYRCVLIFIPDWRSHQVLRDCIISRIVTAVDGQ